MVHSITHEALLIIQEEVEDWRFTQKLDDVIYRRNITSSSFIFVIAIVESLRLASSGVVYNKELTTD